MSRGEPLAEYLARIAHRSTLRLTHYGRKTGKPYEVTIWFVVDGEHVWLATMNAQRQWVRNVARTPRVQVRVADLQRDGRVARLSAQSDLRRAYAGFVDKYWAMWLLDLIARGLGRSPRTSKRLETGRGAFFRVDL